MTNMTSPTKPAAWMQINRDSGEKAARLNLPKKYNRDWWEFQPLYTAAQLQAVREEGVKAGIAAAAKSCENSAHFYSGYNLGSAALETEAAVIRELQPETVLKGDGK